MRGDVQSNGADVVLLRAAALRRLRPRTWVRLNREADMIGARFLAVLALLAGIACTCAVSTAAVRTEQTEDQLRAQCWAKVNDLVPPDFPRWREQKGKL